MKFSPRHLAAAVLLVVLATTLAYSLSLWQDAARLGWPGMGVDVQYSLRGTADRAESRSILLVDTVEPRGPAAEAGIQRGDRITALDGSGHNLIDRFRSLSQGQRVRVTLDGKPPRDVWLQLDDPLHRTSTYFGVIANVLMGLISIAVGSYVFFKRPADSRTLILFVFTTVYSLIRFVQSGPRYRYALYLDARIIPVLLMIAASMLLSPALLHFLLIFPRRRPVLNRFRHLLVWVYAIPAIASIAIGSLFVLSVAYSRPGRPVFDGLINATRPLAPLVAGHELLLWAAGTIVAAAISATLIPRLARDIRAHRWLSAILDHPVRTGVLLVTAPATIAALVATIGRAAHNERVFSAAIVVLVISGVVLSGGIALCLLLLFPLGGFMSALRSYRESGKEERQQLKWPLLGVLVAIPVYVLLPPLLAAVRWAFHMPFDSMASVILHNLDRHLPNLALLLIPVSVAFAVQKYRLMDIDVYVRRTAVYGVVSAILGMVYLLVVGGLGGAVSNVMTSGGEWVAIGSTLIIATLFIPVRNRVQRFVDRRFYRDTDYPAALRELAVTLARQDKRAELLQAAVESIREAAKVRGVSLWLQNRQSGDIACEAKSGTPDTVFEFSISSGRVMSEALKKAGPPQWSVLTPQETTALRAARAAFLVPVRSASGHTGFLTLGAKLSDAAFDAQDIGFAEAAAAQIATLLETVRTREEEQDFERARDIQTAMLPKSIPQPPGISIYGSWQPARFIGGDYYDVIDLGSGRYGIAIADVSGKGLSAALLMSNLQAAVRVLAFDVAPPAVVCDRANRIICRNVTPGRFITFFYGILDTARGTLVYSNAGHNPPLLLRSTGETVYLDEGGPLLGYFQNAEYTEQTIELHPDDRLLLYTDGLSEAEDASGEEFGEERLRQILAHSKGGSAADLGQRLIDEAGKFCSGRFEDDVTLLVVVMASASGATAGAETTKASRKVLPVVAVICVAFCLPGAGAPPPRPNGAAIDAEVGRTMSRTNANGMAVAIIDGGRVRYVHAYGVRNAKREPLTMDTIMYGASLTKTVFAYAVMQLVDRGKLNLDTPLKNYLEKPLPAYGSGPAFANKYGPYNDLSGDSRWERITPRMCLTHSTGFHNFWFSEPDQKLRIHFEPGSRYSYSGEGLILLQFVIEHGRKAQGLGLDVGGLTQADFDRLGMSRTSLMWRDDFAVNLADGWNDQGQPQKHDDRSKVRAAGSMDTTISDMAKFAAALVRGDGLSASSRAELTKRQLHIGTANQFPVFAADLPVDKQRKDLYAGLGVVVFDGPQGHGFFKGGHDGQTANTMVCFEASQRCVVILSNDVRSEAGFSSLVRFILGETGVPYDWEYGDRAGKS